MTKPFATVTPPSAAQFHDRVRAQHFTERVHRSLAARSKEPSRIDQRAFAPRLQIAGVIHRHGQMQAARRSADGGKPRRRQRCQRRNAHGPINVISGVEVQFTGVRTRRRFCVPRDVQRIHIGARIREINYQLRRGRAVERRSFEMRSLALRGGVVRYPEQKSVARGKAAHEREVGVTLHESMFVFRMTRGRVLDVEFFEAMLLQDRADDVAVGDIRPNVGFVFAIHRESGIGAENIKHRGLAAVFEMNLLTPHRAFHQSCHAVLCRNQNCDFRSGGEIVFFEQRQVAFLNVNYVIQAERRRFSDTFMDLDRDRIAKLGIQAAVKLNGESFSHHVILVGISISGAFEAASGTPAMLGGSAKPHTPVSDSGSITSLRSAICQKPAGLLR